MPKIYKYRKVTDKFTTHTLKEPDVREGETRITELCTVAGETFVSVPDGVKMPVQPATIASTVKEVLNFKPGEKDKIKKASPYVRLISQRVVEKIRKRYSINDELKMLRTGPTAETAEYFDYCEACVAWGKAEKAKLGV